jgi:hypothetical protein
MESREMTKYGEWRIRKMAKYGAAKCGRKLAYLGHMTSVFYSVKCWTKLTHRDIQ